MAHVKAVRMACSMGWNLQGQHDGTGSEDSDSEDAVYVQYLWWTLVMQDIWSVIPPYSLTHGWMAKSESEHAN